jgi:hypothetical protein
MNKSPPQGVATIWTAEAALTLPKAWIRFRLYFAQPQNEQWEICLPGSLILMNRGRANICQWRIDFNSTVLISTLTSAGVTCVRSNSTFVRSGKGILPPVPLWQQLAAVWRHRRKHSKQFESTEISNTLLYQGCVRGTIEQHFNDLCMPPLACESSFCTTVRRQLAANYPIWWRQYGVGWRQSGGTPNRRRQFGHMYCVGKIQHLFGLHCEAEETWALRVVFSRSSGDCLNMVVQVLQTDTSTGNDVVEEQHYEASSGWNSTRCGLINTF